MALNSPLPPSPAEDALAGCAGNATCLCVLFLTRSPRPFMRQVSRALGWFDSGMRWDARRVAALAVRHHS